MKIPEVVIAYLNKMGVLKPDEQDIVLQFSQGGKMLVSRFLLDFVTFKATFRRLKMANLWEAKFPETAKAMKGAYLGAFMDDMENFGMCRITTNLPPVGEPVQVSDGNYSTTGIWWGASKKWEIGNLSVIPPDFDPLFWNYLSLPDMEL